MNATTSQVSKILLKKKTTTKFDTRDHEFAGLYGGRTRGRTGPARLTDCRLGARPRVTAHER